MLGILFDWIKDFPEKIGCKNCNYKSLFAIGMLHHLLKCHNIKATKRDLRFLLKYNFASRFFRFLVACVLIPPLFILKLVCGLLGEFSEIL